LKIHQHFFKVTSIAAPNFLNMLCESGMFCYLLLVSSYTNILFYTGNCVEFEMDADSADKSTSDTVTKQYLLDDQPRPYVCTVCDKWFRKKEYLYVHRKSHTETKLYTCSQCQKCFSSMSALCRHVNIHTDKFKCPECGRCFRSTDDLVIHARSHSKEKPFECSVCNKHFARASSLIRHCRVHSGEKPYTCYVCGRAFSQSSNLNDHLRIHMGDKLNKCDRSLSQTCTMQEHNHCAHSNDGLRQCPHCEMEFSGDGLNKLKQHPLKSHSEGKRLTCEICQKMFTERHTLRVHMKRHEGLKPYVCSECPKCFCTAYELKRHQTVHSDVRQFSCSLCCQTYKRQKDARRHFSKCSNVQLYRH